MAQVGGDAMSLVQSAQDSGWGCCPRGCGVRMKSRDALRQHREG